MCFHFSFLPCALHTAPNPFVRTRSYQQYRGAFKSLVRPGRKQAYVSVRMALISFGALPCRKINLMPARVSILLKSRASLTCFRACFLPGRAKDLSAPRYFAKSTNYEAPRHAIYSLPVTRPPQQQTPNAIYVTCTTVTEPNNLPAVSHSAHRSDCLATEAILNLTLGYLDQQSPAHGIDDRRIGVRCKNRGMHFSSSQHPDRI